MASSHMQVDLGPDPHTQEHARVSQPPTCGNCKYWEGMLDVNDRRACQRIGEDCHNASIDDPLLYS